MKWRILLELTETTGSVQTREMVTGGFCRKFCVWTMRPWNNDVDYAASELNCCAGHNLLVARNWPLRIICMSRRRQGLP